jgi:hypothetical protein
MSYTGGVVQRCKSPPDSYLAPDALGLAGREHLGAQLPPSSIIIVVNRTHYGEGLWRRPCGGALGGVVAWEKRGKLLMKACLISMYARWKFEWVAYA